MDDAELKRLIEQSGEETRRHFDVVAEGLDRKIETVAEAVVNLEQKVDRKFEEVTHQFSETQAMIKFSYAELDRRLRSVEGELSDLRQRVDRLESSSTH